MFEHAIAGTAGRLMSGQIFVLHWKTHTSPWSVRLGGQHKLLTVPVELPVPDPAMIPVEAPVPEPDTEPEPLPTPLAGPPGLRMQRFPAGIIFGGQ